MANWTRSDLDRLLWLQLEIQELIEDLGTDAPGVEALIGANEDLANAALCATATVEIQEGEALARSAWVMEA